MAQKGLKAFEEALKDNEELRRRFEEALQGVTDAASYGEAVQKAAAQLGFDLSLEELEQAWAAAQELDAEELDGVSGGEDEYGHSDWCLHIWHCYTVVFHTSTKSKGVACWSDYMCGIWSK